MRDRKIVVGFITGVLCLGLLNGCSNYSHDFNSREEAQKYILTKLEDKYNEEFTITEVKKYKMCIRDRCRAEPGETSRDQKIPALLSADYAQDAERLC